MLDQYGGTTISLCESAGESFVAQVTLISVGASLSRGKQDNGGTGTRIEFAGPPEALLKGSLFGVFMVDELVESALTRGGIGGTANAEELEIEINRWRKRRKQSVGESGEFDLGGDGGEEEGGDGRDELVSHDGEEGRRGEAGDSKERRRAE